MAAPQVVTRVMGLAVQGSQPLGAPVLIHDEQGPGFEWHPAASGADAGAVAQHRVGAGVAAGAAALAVVMARLRRS